MGCSGRALRRQWRAPSTACLAPNSAPRPKPSPNPNLVRIPNAILTLTLSLTPTPTPTLTRALALAQALAQTLTLRLPRYGFAQPIVLQGCLGGVGVGVDARNIITALRPGFPAHACGLMAAGDRVVSIDGVRLAYKGQVWQLAIPSRSRSRSRSCSPCPSPSPSPCPNPNPNPNPNQVWQLAQVMKRSPMHIFGVERRLWELDEPDDDDDGGDDGDGGDRGDGSASSSVGALPTVQATERARRRKSLTLTPTLTLPLTRPRAPASWWLRASSASRKYPASSQARRLLGLGLHLP